MKRNSIRGDTKRIITFADPKYIAWLKLYHPEVNVHENPEVQSMNDNPSQENFLISVADELFIHQTLLSLSLSAKLTN